MVGRYELPSGKECKLESLKSYLYLSLTTHQEVEFKNKHGETIIATPTDVMNHVLENTDSEEIVPILLSLSKGDSLCVQSNLIESHYKQSVIELIDYYL